MTKKVTRRLTAESALPVAYGDQSYSEAFVVHASPEHSLNHILILNGLGLDALVFSLYTVPYMYSGTVPMLCTYIYLKGY